MAQESTDQLEEKKHDNFQDVNDFLKESTPPKDLDETRTKLKQFIEHHKNSSDPFVLITSGGTTVPLEKNTIRFIDNFSGGTRGSASVEYFLQNNCNVIFLQRKGSISPFIRHISNYLNVNLFDKMSLNKDKVTIQLDDHKTNSLQNIFETYEKYARKLNKLLVLNFTSVNEYFHATIECCKAFKLYSSTTTHKILYFAAAVSDFYIPENKMEKDKIQSSSGPLTLKLDNTPKMLGYFKSLCDSNTKMISFKLETKDDTKFLFTKAKKAISKYGSDMVISNKLHTRKQEIWIVTQNDEKHIQLKDSKCQEIEQLIIEYILKQ
eukprot:165125_1